MPTTKSRYVLYAGIVVTFLLLCMSCVMFITHRHVTDLLSIAASLWIFFACIGGLIIERKATTQSTSTKQKQIPCGGSNAYDGKMPPVGARADEEIWTTLAPKTKAFIGLPSTGNNELLELFTKRVGARADEEIWTMAKLTPKQEEFIALLNVDKLTEETAALTYNHAYNVVKGRYESGESVLAKSPKFAFYYARDVLKGRFAQGEAAIATKSHYAYLYAFFIFKGPFRQGEDAIAKSPEYACLYAIHVLKGRFEKGEAAIAKENVINVRDYAKMLTDKKLVKLTTAYDLCLHNPALRPIFELVIAQCAYTSYCYARDVLKGRFILGEDAIAKGSAIYSYEYAKIIKGRFEKGEATIAQDGLYACLYANNLLQGRFEQGEAAIAKDGYMNSYYFKPTDAKVTYPS